MEMEAMQLASRSVRFDQRDVRISTAERRLIVSSSPATASIQAGPVCAPESRLEASGR